MRGPMVRGFMRPNVAALAERGDVVDDHVYKCGDPAQRASVYRAAASSASQSRFASQWSASASSVCSIVGS
jgi:hypothetical protein